MNLQTLAAEVRNNTMCNRKNEFGLTVSKRMQNKLFHLTHSCATADGSCAHLDICVVTSAWKSVNRQAGLVLRQTLLFHNVHFVL